MTIDYRPRGVCSNRMLIDVENGVIRSLQVQGGCNGNLQGISRLVEGMHMHALLICILGDTQAALAVFRAPKAVRIWSRSVVSTAPLGLSAPLLSAVISLP